jgi:ERCC4-related helicase
MKAELRQYQRRAVALGKQQSLIVVLPTGSGKTLIASTIAAYHARNKLKILFLVPTRLLVEQQAKAIRDENDIAVSCVVYGGRVRAIAAV